MLLNLTTDGAVFILNREERTAGWIDSHYEHLLLVSLSKLLAWESVFMPSSCMGSCSKELCYEQWAHI